MSEDNLDIEGAFAENDDDSSWLCSDRERVLADYLEVDLFDVNESRWDDACIEYGRQEYLVLTDAEATERAKESIESLLDEMLHDVPDNLKGYFDRERFVEDVIRYDGRGSVLSSWDGNEVEHEYQGETWYIYQN